MHSKKLSFDNAMGQKLAAYLDQPDNRPADAYAIFSHCFTCNKNYKGIRNICQVLCSHGIAILRFDFTGLGESEGNFTETTFSDNVEDIVMASHFLEKHYQAPSLLLGHSLGGAATLAAAARIPSSRAVVTIASPSEPSHVMDHFPGQQETIDSTGEAIIRVGGIDYTITRQFVEDVRGYDLSGSIENLSRALLILHSPQDSTVDIANAAQIFSKARHPKSFISLDRVDHLIVDKDDACYVGNIIKAWAAPYLNLTPH